MSNATFKDRNLWAANNIQFPRLLAEICATQPMDRFDWDALCEGMDLELHEVDELFDRAQDEWEDIKELYCPR